MVACQQIEQGEKIVVPVEPVREYYIFLGWFLGEDKWMFNIYTVFENITLVAKWVSVDEIKLSPTEMVDKVSPSIVLVKNIRTDNKQSTGSGILIENGYIITNAHCIENYSTLTVKFFDGEIYDVTVITDKPESDIAILKIDESIVIDNGYITAKLGNSTLVKAGDFVSAMGFPRGLFGLSCTFGYISSTDRNVRVESSQLIDSFQTDAAINPGNSGGALVNEYGEVIGINFSKNAEEMYENMGFAIKSNVVLSILEDIVAD